MAQDIHTGDPQPVPLNVYETTDAVVVVAPLPGVMADDVEVRVADGRLEISARMRTPAPKDYIVHEWHYGPWERSIELPHGFGGEAKASFGNGQLAISVRRGEGGGQGDVTVSSAGPGGS